MKFTAAFLFGLIPLALAQNCPPKPATDLEKRAILDTFIDTFLVKKQPANAMRDHVAEDYIQHNPGVLSGRQNAINAFAGMSTASFRYTIITKGFDNNIGWFHYKMEMPGGGQPYAVTDFVRFNGTCIQEHWDVVQQRPANPRNPLALWS
ncbi:hypothetical protein BJ508DRAFT_133764 [Ascobolus immersus RN42]|uniref:SnoaL-like domain-containing protein n=1 Tax=Ascobolus immersus RN42 TaxID=1160509 RepID=A0A3N4IJW7_ASCIM|nr:hypothetical protein BJ508DRAFT_133764 [Ascobolus immersus RN42]